MFALFVSQQYEQRKIYQKSKKNVFISPKTFSPMLPYMPKLTHGTCLFLLLGAISLQQSF